MELKLPNIQLVDNAMLIIWNCRVLQNESHAECEECIQEDDTVILGSIEESSESEKEDIPRSGPYGPHTIVFKCSGAARDTQPSSITPCADRMLCGWTVPVRIRPEPTQIADSRAIVFECELDSKWQKIGCVVSEILDEVHTAMTRNFMSVEFKCIN